MEQNNLMEKNLNMTCKFFEDSKFIKFEIKYKEINLLIKMLTHVKNKIKKEYEAEVDT